MIFLIKLTTYSMDNLDIHKLNMTKLVPSEEKLSFYDDLKKIGFKSSIKKQKRKIIIEDTKFKIVKRKKKPEFIQERFPYKCDRCNQYREIGPCFVYSNLPNIDEYFPIIMNLCSECHWCYYASRLNNTAKMGWLSYNTFRETVINEGLEEHKIHSKFIEKCIFRKLDDCKDLLIEDIYNPLFDKNIMRNNMDKSIIYKISNLENIYNPIIWDDLKSDDDIIKNNFKYFNDQLPF